MSHLRKDLLVVIVLGGHFSTQIETLGLDLGQLCVGVREILCDLSRELERCLLFLLAFGFRMGAELSIE